MENQGLLQVVGTPIGNLADISERAKLALAGADLVACEDTRRCGQLYRLLGIATPKMVSCYKENEVFRSEQIVKELKAGKTVVLVSDGGMPGISDPGAKLVAAARRGNVRVEVIPGPSAVTTAVAGTGFEGGFVFVGFPERKAVALAKQVEGFKREVRHLAFYESPQRVEVTVEALLKGLGNREAWLARELTKMHEEWIGPDLAGIHNELVRRGEVRGECVLVVHGAKDVLESIEISDQDLASRLAEGGSVKDVAAWLAEMAGVSKKEAYARVQALKEAE